MLLVLIFFLCVQFYGRDKEKARHDFFVYLENKSKKPKNFVENREKLGKKCCLDCYVTSFVL